MATGTWHLTPNSEDHLSVLDDVSGFAVSRQYVVVDRLFAEGEDTGVAVCYDKGFCTMFTVTVVQPVRCAISFGINQVLRYIRRWLKRESVVTLQNTGALSGLTEAVRNRTCYSQIQESEFILFRMGRIDRSASFDCVFTVGWSVILYENDNEEEQEYEIVIPGDDLSVPRRRVCMKSLTNIYSVNAITASRRRVSVSRRSDGRAKVRLDRPIALVAHLSCSDVPFKMRCHNSPDISSNRINKIPSDSRFTTFDVQTSLGVRQVQAVWELGSLTADIRPGDPYEVLKFYSSLGKIGSLKEDNIASVIQRWWRRITCNPHHPVGNRLLRREFEAGFAVYNHLRRS
nr:hypothetical protein TetV2_00612 [Oceanusvirus sp.]